MEAREIANFRNLSLQYSVYRNGSSSSVAASSGENKLATTEEIIEEANKFAEFILSGMFSPKDS